MKLRAFGDTGILLPALSIGTAALGRPAYLTVGHGEDIANSSVSGMRRLTFDVLDEAYAAGVRHIDTAHSYGLSERFIADWLDETARNDVFLTSKWGYSYVGDWGFDAHPQEVKDLTLATFARQVPLSFHYFGSRLSGIQIHSATLESGVLSNGAVLDAMSSVASAGVAIGVSTSGPSQAAAIDAVTSLATSERVPFAFVQVTWNILETSAADALLRAREAGIAVILKEALANGRLARGNAIPGSVLKLAAEYEVGPDAVCLAAAMALECEPVVLAGPACVEHLKSNLQSVSLHLRDDALARLTREAIDPHAYWQQRSVLRWT